MDAERVLIIILASTLTVFLLLLIAVTIKIIQIVSQLKKIADKAEHLVESASNIGDFFKHTSGIAVIGNLLSNVTDVIKKKGKQHGEEE